MPPPPLARRRALALLAGGALAALAPDPARAWRRWCRVDPLLRIEGQDLHLWVAVRAADMRRARRLVRGPVEVAVVLPPGVGYARLDDAEGFGDGFAVVPERDPGLAAGGGRVALRVRVRVRTRGRRRPPVEVWLQPLEKGPIPDRRAYGRADRWVELTVP